MFTGNVGFFLAVLSEGRGLVIGLVSSLILGMILHMLEEPMLMENDASVRALELGLQPDENHQDEDVSQVDPIPNETVPDFHRLFAHSSLRTQDAPEVALLRHLLPM